MDCVTSRQFLDLYSPGGGDAEAVQAQKHVAECSECAAVADSRRRFDLRLGAVCRDVPVPAGLKERLLSAVAAAAQNQPAQSELVPSAQPERNAGELEVTPSRGEMRQATTRQPYEPAREPTILTSVPAKGRTQSSTRRWTWIAAACLLLFSASLAMLWPTSRNVPFEVVVEVVATPNLVEAQHPLFTGFSASSTFSTPVSLQLPRSSRVASVIRAQPRLIVVQGQPCAVYFFTMTGRRRATVPGRLLVLPKSLVQNPKAMTNALPTMGAWSVAAWSEGDLVYVLTVAGHDELRQLEPQNVTI